jgi:hypothetical protein
MFFSRCRTILALLSLAALLALTGCAANTVVPLRYQASTPKNGLTCSQPLTVLPFEDKRADTLTIGTLGDGKRYYPANDPVEWISWAVFEELKARGCDVKYREKASTAPAPKGYVVSGSFDKVNVEHGAALTVKAGLRVRVKVEKDGAWVMEQNYSGERESLGVTYVDAAQSVLASTLQYILQDAATDVVKAAK